MRDARRSPFTLLCAVGVAVGLLGCDREGLRPASGMLVVNGHSGAPGAEVALDFGEVFEGRDKSLSVTIRNGGRGALTIVGLEWTTPSAAFVSTELDGRTLAAGQSRSFEVRFKPPVTSADAPVESYEARLGIRASGTADGDITVVLAITGMGVHEGCALPERLDFGTVPVGQAHTLELRTRNQAGSARQPGPTALESSDFDHHAFSVDDDESPVGPGMERVIGVRFEPIEARPYLSSLKLASFDGCPQHQLELKGEGADKVVQASPVDFGFIPVGHHRSVALRIENVGLEPVRLSQLRFAGAGAAVFGDGGQPWPSTLDIPERSFVTLQVACAPDEAKRFDASLELRTDLEPQSTLSVPLQCHGGGPRIQIEPEELLDFGKVAYVAGATPPVYQLRWLSIRNQGTRYTGLPDERLFLGKDGAGPPYFFIEPLDANTHAGEFQASLVENYNPTIGLPANSPRVPSIEIRLTPRSIGLKEAFLVIYSNDFLRPEIRVRLRGEAAEYGPCNFSLSTSSLAFGRVPPGTSRELAFTVKNHGTDPLDVCLLSAPQLGPESDPAFSLVDGPIPSRDLAPGEELEVRVRVAPTPASAALVRPIAGSVSLQVSSPLSPHVQVPLTADVGKSCLTIAPTRVDFGALGPGCPNGRTEKLEIRNTCSDNLYVDGVTLASGSTDYSLQGVPPLGTGFLLRPHIDVFRFDVRFSPLQLGMRSGAVRIASRDAVTTSSELIQLEGIGDPLSKQTDGFKQGTGEVDILLLLGDDENGFQPAEYILVHEFDYASRMEVFVDHLRALGVDFHLGVIGSGPSQTGAWSYERGALLSIPTSPETVLTSTTPDLLPKVQAKLYPPYPNHRIFVPYFSGLWTSTLALSPQMLTGPNIGFLRPGAKLAILHANRDYRYLGHPRYARDPHDANGVSVRLPRDKGPFAPRGLHLWCLHHDSGGMWRPRPGLGRNFR